MPGKFHTAPQTARFHTIGHTLAGHERDPGHRFHVRQSRMDQRNLVAVGARLQRVRGRAHAN